MGIKKFFKKVGSGIKKGASWVKDKFHKTVNVVKKFGKHVLYVANKVSGYLAMVPGKVGMVASGINAGTGIANDILDKIPNGNVKNKVSTLVNQAGSQANDKLNQFGNKVQQISDKVNQGMNIAKDISNIPKVKQLLNQT